MYKVFKDCEQIAIIEKPVYIKSLSDGTFTPATEADCQGIAINSVPYNLFGCTAMDGVTDTVVLCECDGGIVMTNKADLVDGKVPESQLPDISVDAYSRDEVDTKFASVNTELESVKTSVSEGKALIAEAVTDKGVETASDATFSTIADNIANINTYAFKDNTWITEELPIVVDGDKIGVVIPASYRGYGFSFYVEPIFINAPHKNGNGVEDYGTYAITTITGTCFNEGSTYLYWYSSTHYVSYLFNNSNYYSCYQPQQSGNSPDTGSTDVYAYATIANTIKEYPATAIIHYTLKK